MLLSFALVVVGLTLQARAATRFTVEQVSGLPQGWSLQRRAGDDDAVAVFAALRQPRMDELKARLSERVVSENRDTESHLSQQEVQEYRKADRSSVDAVSQWLLASSIPHTRPSDSWIGFNLTAREAASLLGAELGWYSYQGGVPVLRAREYTVPGSLEGHIDFIHPLANFIPPRRPRRQPGPAKFLSEVTALNASTDIIDLPCATGVFPECIKQLYNITYNATAPSPVRFGIAGFLEQWINYLDVEEFIDAYTPQLVGLNPPYNFTVELINNGTNPQDPLWSAGLEASLDVEYAMTIGYPTNVIYYSTGGRGVKLDGSGAEIPVTGSDNEPYLEFLESMLAKPDSELPHVLSISYADDEQSVPHPYAVHVCDLFAQLTARGVSILAASGDGGAAGTGQNYCFTNDIEQRRMLIPTFPASCPWVTSVGATNNEGPPIEAADFSAGGFSRYFGRPAWQDGVVDPYLEKLARGNDTKLSMVDQSGRAIPDISAVGAAYQIEYSGSLSTVLGTSASTPVVAAMIALINDARLRAGKASLGWLNPLLYEDKVRSTLIDVVDGRGQGCDFGDPAGTSDGWAAVEGYDCVTGLGTPGDFSKLLDALA